MKAALRQDHRFTVRDYMTWDDGERWELIDGAAYNMSPAPSTRHQRIAGAIFRDISIALKGKSCRAFIAPTDVVLSEFDVVQPDVLVVCDEKKITPANIQGAPDLVIEVLSPSTSLKDLREKKTLYERCGVREYIVVHPGEELVEVYRLGTDGRFGAQEVVGAREELDLNSIGVRLSLVEVFELDPVESEQPRPPA